MQSTKSLSDALSTIVSRAKVMSEEAARNPEVRARLDELAAKAEAGARAEEARAREESWEKRGIPPRLWPMFNASVLGDEEGPIDSPALRSVGTFVAPSERRTLLVLAGGVGTGKTVAAAWGCAFHSGRLAKAIDLIRIGMFDESSALPVLAHCRLLAVDDLGMEPMDSKGYAYAAVYDLLDRRYDAALKTIITTNLTTDQFRERYGTGAGARLWDRIREIGVWFNISGPSLRRSR